MRITGEQRAVITQAIARNFGPDATVLLFGSRVDDAARGGDIDILVQTDRFPPNAEEAVIAKLTALAEMQRRMGDRKIDLIVAGTSSEDEVVRQARVMGIPL